MSVSMTGYHHDRIEERADDSMVGVGGWRQNEWCRFPLCWCWARPPDVCHCGAATRGGQSSGKWELNCPGHSGQCGHGRNTRTRYFSSG